MPPKFIGRPFQQRALQLVEKGEEAIGINVKLLAKRGCVSIV
jgi:hypothetical protein